MNKSDFLLWNPLGDQLLLNIEESAIRKGFDNLADGQKYDNLYAAALCRAKADWLRSAAFPRPSWN